MNRRDFMRGGVAAFTVSFAAPRFLSELALAQGQGRRNLVVLYLSGGNDALSTLIPYTDWQYVARRPTLAIPAASVLQVGSDSSGRPLGLHPRLNGLRRSSMRDVSRSCNARATQTRAVRISRARTSGPRRIPVAGRLRLAGEISRQVPVARGSAGGVVDGRDRAADASGRTVGVPAIPSAAQYAFASPNGGADAGFARDARCRIASHTPVDRPQLAFVNATGAGGVRDARRVGRSRRTKPSHAYPNNGLAQALQSGGRRDGERCRHARVLRADRQLRHARRAEHQPGQRRLHGADGDAERRGLFAFYNDLTFSRPVRRHAGAAVLRVRAAHRRERQRRHGSRRRQRDDGAGGRRARRHLRHRAQPSRRDRQPDARERRGQGSSSTRPTSARSTPP